MRSASLLPKAPGAPDCSASMRAIHRWTRSPSFHSLHSISSLSKNKGTFWSTEWWFLRPLESGNLLIANRQVFPLPVLAQNGPLSISAGSMGTRQAYLSTSSSFCGETISLLSSYMARISGEWSGQSLPYGIKPRRLRVPSSTAGRCHWDDATVSACRNRSSGMWGQSAETG